MDEDSMRNWGYYEPPLRGHLGLQLMTSMADCDTKPFLSTRGGDTPVMVSPNGTYHPRDCIVNEPPISQIDYVRDSWFNHREKFMHMFPDSSESYNSIHSEYHGTHQLVQMVHQSDKETSTTMEEQILEKEDGQTKKRAAAAPKLTPKPKKPRKSPVPKENGNPSSQRAKTSKRNVEVVINGVDMDIAGIPIPVCSCTGTPQQCYRWGCGGWQSACCTTTISMYPLPMSTKRRGARIAGRKMSQGAFKKVLEKLASEGYDFTTPIDLRTYWAKHGTNKFVVIR